MRVVSLDLFFVIDVDGLMLYLVILIDGLSPLLLNFMNFLNFVQGV
jgi:hypothetical protein